MDVLAVFDVILLGVVVVTAVIAVLLRRRQGAVAAFLVFGVLLAVLWARLGAPDIAVAEAVLGGGITGALLVDALSGSAGRHPTGATRRWWIAGGFGVAGAVVVATGLLAVTMRLSPPTGALPAAVASAAPASGAEHPVTAVLLNFRSFDTLLEIAVVMIAAFAATAVSDGAWARRLEAHADLGRIGTLLVPAVLLLAGWFLVAGTTRPGGAFQSGAMVSAGLLIAYLTGARGASTRGIAGEWFVALGTLSFIALAGATAVWGDGWLVLPEAGASAIILAIEAVLAISIGVGLARIFVANRRAEREVR
ncbi:MnhB domain-containing protein [Leucobacter tardus]|uniref:DUF4040 domain-containing protein n=1 Tax=Leucobacter tardus TaxID=501483 RepID=A0A939TMZ3_9MICO|nr:hydrogenase subunit MbhD domain-containing protein [Leucobacter tardus]MBO2989684.1 DUF4040 domain-containing protein [Leucobacter tardus]